MHGVEWRHEEMDWRPSPFLFSRPEPSELSVAGAHDDCYLLFFDVHERMKHLTMMYAYFELGFT